jgi:signal transduction histidine kinase
MRIATRLVLVLGLTTTAVMGIYGVIALEQREELLRDALARETETLARSTQIVVDNAVRDGRFQDLDRVLRRIAEDPQTVIAVVLDSEGRLLAGGPADALACLDGVQAVGPEGARGWAECDGGMRWVVLPVRDPADRVALGRRATVLERDRASSRRRILVTTLVLAAAAGGAMVLVLRFTLSSPLSHIMVGVRTLGGPRSPSPVLVPRTPVELRELAEAFNEMAERLEGKRQALIEEVEDRVALERKLRSSEKFAALGRLAGGLAHEIGSPLNTISIRAEAIQTTPGVPEAVRREAGEILAEVERIARLVRGLRHVGRGDPLEPRPVDLAQVVAQAADDARERVGAPARSVRVEPGAPIVVPGDQTLLRHAVANLALNALQASAGARAPGEVTMRVERDAAGARIVVEDDGPGLPEEVRHRLFEPFFTTREVGEGMGLGLAITRGIAEEHGGELRLEEREGGGTRATIWLPAAEGGGQVA